MLKCQQINHKIHNFSCELFLRILLEIIGTKSRERNCIICCGSVQDYFQKESLLF